MNMLFFTVTIKIVAVGAKHELYNVVLYAGERKVKAFNFSKREK